MQRIFDPTRRGYFLSADWRAGMMSPPVLLAPLGSAAPPGDFAAYAASVALGLSVTSCTIVWSVISSDPLCDGTKATGIISGAVNTLCIGYDAIIQQVVGVVLSSMWDGKKNASHEPVYSAEAFSCAFSVLAGSFLAAGVCSTVAGVRAKPS